MTEPARYRLVRTIATGGMAQVLEAESVGHDGFTRRVAIKRVLPELAHDRAIRRMFFDEARIASRLHHGGIVQVHDYGVLDGSEFIVLEYVDGVDLERAARHAEQEGQPISEGLALHVISEVAHALAYAHDKTDAQGEPLSIVHRDVSPQNILLSWDGDVKLSDFGIAIATDRREKTRTGHVKGKLRFMAPEQAAADRAVTGAADVYALGATLLRLLSGEAPPSVFERDEDGLELPLTLSDVAAELVRSCTAPDPSDRPDPTALADRAGRRAAKLLERDGRGAVTDWLKGIRPAFSQPDALSELQDMFVVPGEAPREFKAKKGVELAASGDAATVRARRRPRPIPDTAGGADAPNEDPPQQPVGSGKRRWVAGAAALAMVIAAAAYVMLEPPGPEPIAASEESREPDEVAVIEDPELPPPTETASTEVALAPPEPSVVDPAPSPRSLPRARSRRLAPPPEAAPATEPAQTQEPTQEAASVLRAYIALPRALGGRVRVDGTTHFTPDVVAVRPGSHTIEVLDADGDAEWRTTASVSAAHTSARPYVVQR